MLYLDIPTRDEIEALYRSRHPSSVSLVVETTPVSGEVAGDPIRLKNAWRDAEQQLPAADREAMAAHIDALVDDQDFWRFQAHSLVLFLTPERLYSFRLANRLKPAVEVADRFLVKPLLRATTFPQAAYILALSEDRARLFELAPVGPLVELEVDSLPQGAGDRPDAAQSRGRRPAVRMRSGEGERKAYEKYAHGIDRALRPFLNGQELPLIVAADGRLGAIFRQRASYPHLAHRDIDRTPDDMAKHELADAARAVLDEVNRARIAEWHQRFDERRGAGRTTTDLEKAARAATMGAIEWLAVDMDRIVHGRVDEEGRVSLVGTPGPECHGVVDEIARRAFLAGGRVRALREDDLPEPAPLAATLRWPV